MAKKARSYTQEEVNALLAAQSVTDQKIRYVGIRWFGAGGVTVRMKNGNDSVVLQGYGDAGVIDHATWKFMRDKHLVGMGMIVRDDSAIEEEGFEGITETPDNERASDNGFLDDEIISLLNGTANKFKKIVANLTTHQACTHFIQVAKNIEFNDASRISIVRARYTYLLTKYRWALLLDHDLRPACEQYKIDWTALSREEMIEELTNIQIQSE